MGVQHSDKTLFDCERCKSLTDKYTICKNCVYKKITSYQEALLKASSKAYLRTDGTVAIGDIGIIFAGTTKVDIKNIENMLAKLDLLYRYRRQETEEIVFRYPTESYSAYSTFFYPDGAPVQKDILDWISWIEQGGGPVETYNLRGWGILPENNYEKSWVKICEVWNPNNSATWRDDNGDYA